MRSVGGRAARPEALRRALLCLALVLLLLGLAFASLRSFELAHDLADHTAQVTERLWRSLQLLTDAETGQRGFLLTGDAAYLEPYEHARRDVPQVMQDLRDLVRSPEQQASLARLDGLANAKLQVVAEGVALQNEGQRDAALGLFRSERGRQMMVEFRDVQASMVRAEDAILARRTRSGRLFVRVSFAIIVAACAALLVVGFQLLLVARHVRELAAARITDLENFAGWVAHDIRSPLQGVSFAVAYAKRHPDEPKTRAVLDEATRTLGRVGTLVEGLLQFGRAGAPSLEGERSDVRRIVDDVLEAAATPARERSVSVRADDVCATTVACSAGVLTSMLSNLVDNAVRYMGEGPVKRVSVGARTDGSTTRIEVRDTGRGVPPALRATIFDPHVSPQRPDASGPGLGLATVRRLAEAHGGSVGVASNVPAGSVFWLDLPNAPQASDHG